MPPRTLLQARFVANEDQLNRKNRFACIVDGFIHFRTVDRVTIPDAALEKASIWCKRKPPKGWGRAKSSKAGKHDYDAKRVAPQRARPLDFPKHGIIIILAGYSGDCRLKIETSLWNVGLIIAHMKTAGAIDGPAAVWLRMCTNALALPSKPPPGTIGQTFYGQETKAFGEPELPAGWHARVSGAMKDPRNETAECKAVVGSPDLGRLRASRLEWASLSVRQESRRFQRSVGYSKNLNMHQMSSALYFNVYNFVRGSALGSRPAVATGAGFKPWRLEDVGEMPDVYLGRKEDATFEAAFAKLDY